MIRDNGNLWIVFNGEIYNYKELRSTLERKYYFETESDTEVLLFLFREKGAACLRELRGMFAFTIYDRSTRTLFTARDHFGQKPFYYVHSEKGFAFASEIKALLAFDPTLAQLDNEALCEYLTLRIITPPRSMFQHIRKLPPAHYLIYREGKIEIRRYWTLDYTKKRNLKIGTLLEELSEKLIESVNYHLVSDVPVGALLSGGLDSSLLVAFMSHTGGQSFKTFTGDLQYKNWSELPYAEVVARKFGTDSHIMRFEPSMIQCLPQILWHLDEPSDTLPVPLFFLAKLAARHVKVVIGGDGGDELFGGYDRYYGNVFARYLAVIPGPIRREVLQALLNRLPHGGWYQSISHKLKWLNLDISLSASGAVFQEPFIFLLLRT
jgi:asparagine synthase (glutamine-hydrolysing)